MNDKTFADGTLGTETRLTRVGRDPRANHGFVNPPIVRGSTVLFDSAKQLKGREGRFRYGLSGTPTTEALEAALSELENAHGTVLVPSGLAAVTLPLLAFLKSGDHALFADCIYGPTRRFADSVLRRLGVEVEYFDPARPDDVPALLRPTTRTLFLEAPGSNTFEMMDVRKAAEAAKAVGAVTMVDNTWATPLLFKPLENGADLSIHALTKYPGGHSDLLLGSVSANRRTYAQLRDTQMTIGINAGAEDSFLVLRGLRTMAVRLERHAESALQLAEWLTTRDEVANVLYPALPGFAGHDLWRQQFRGASGLFSFVLNGTEKEAEIFLDSLRLFGIGFSWGGFESLVIPVDLSDRTIPTVAGTRPVIRLQIGLETLADLRHDLERGFAALREARGL